MIHKFDRKYPLAGSTVDGLDVLANIPNRSSISASLNEYEILHGIREVSFSYFKQAHFATPTQRIKQLAEEIKTSKSITPLIVVIDDENDKEGPYILEGGHRFDALHLLKINKFPALVVIDTELVSLEGTP